jgi:hypothetical protein
MRMIDAVAHVRNVGPAVAFLYSSSGFSNRSLFFVLGLIGVGRGDVGDMLRRAISIYHKGRGAHDWTASLSDCCIGDRVAGGLDFGSVRFGSGN